LGGPVDAGVNLRCRLIGEAGARTIAKAAEVGCERFAILGDLFDRGKPSPEEIGVAAKVFAESPIPVYVIPGNHDRSSDEPGNNALAALVGTKNCIVVDEPLFLQPEGIILAPFSPHPPVEYFTELLERAGEVDWSILGHVGIVGPDTSPFLTNGRNIINVEQIFELGENLRVFASGDFHQHVIHEGVLGAVNIVQVGALCQANFGDPLEVGKLCVLDGGGITEFHDVAGPRFITLTASDLMWKPWHWGLQKHDVFLSVLCETPEDTATVGKILDEGPAFVRGWKTELVSTAKQQTEVVEAVQGVVQVEDALQEWAVAQLGVRQAVKDRAVQIALECLR
jgi:hypothetical protein